MTRRALHVLSSGSIAASVEGRKAWERLRAIGMEGYFDTVEYTFFPAPSDRVERPEAWLTVRDVSGSGGEGVPGRVGRLLACFREVHRIADDLRPDVVGCVDPFLSGLAAWTVARRFRVPWTLHLVSNYRLSFEVGGLNPMPYLPPLLTFAVEKGVLRSSDLVLADCRHYAEYAVERSARPRRVRTVPRYADPVFYRTEPDPGIWDRLDVPDPSPLVYVGRLGPEKYALELLETFVHVAREMPDRHLVVLGGGGPLEEEVLGRAAGAGVEGRIRIVRGLERPDLASAMGASGALLATHAGYALLEAALVGAPIVAYDYEWHPELVDDGRTGRLVPYRDPGAMARAALDLLGDPATARSLGRAARERARREYSPRASVRAQRDAYRWVLEGRSGGS